MFDNPWLILVFITLIPGIELRLSIPYGISAGLDPLLVFIVAFFVNVAVILPSFLFLGLVFKYVEKISFLQSFIEKVRSKTGCYVEKYGFIGLALFVAIPLPGSGAYTGVLGAHLLGIKKRKAVPAITFGVFAASVIVSLASIGIFAVF